MSHDSSHFLQLEGAERRYGERYALRETSLSIRRGERVAIIGPSGSGKSTLIKLLGASLAPSAGTIRIAGQNVEQMSRSDLLAYRAQCGLVEQGLQLIAPLSVHRNVCVGLLPGWSHFRTMLSLCWPLERQRVAELLLKLGLEDRQWDPVQVLSGGERQRVAIARGLVHEPCILLADEPTSALDPVTAKSVVSLLLRETASRELSLILSTHWVSVVRDHVSRFVGLRDGRVVLDTSPAELTDKMLDELYAGTSERQ